LIKQPNRFALIVIIVCISFALYGQETKELAGFEYGKRLKKEELFDLAALQFQQFVEKYPNSPLAGEAQFLSSECHFLLERYKNAQKGYLKTLVQYSDSPVCDQAQFRIGECYEKMGKFDDAISLLIHLVG